MSRDTATTTTAAPLVSQEENFFILNSETLACGTFCISTGEVFMTTSSDCPEEASTVASWTSSLPSLSPDNPAYSAPSSEENVKGEKRELPVMQFSSKNTTAGTTRSDQNPSSDALNSNGTTKGYRGSFPLPPGSRRAGLDEEEEDGDTLWHMDPSEDGDPAQDDECLTLEEVKQVDVAQMGGDTSQTVANNSTGTQQGEVSLEQQFEGNQVNTLRLPATIQEEGMPCGNESDDHRGNPNIVSNSASSPLPPPKISQASSDEAQGECESELKRRRARSFDDLSIAQESSKSKARGHCTGDLALSPLHRQEHADGTSEQKLPPHYFPIYTVVQELEQISRKWLRMHEGPFAASTWIGFWALLFVTCANYVLTPMRDAIALSVGVEYMPNLTLASTLLAFCSSVPIGWLFEAPDPSRRRLFKRMGLTRGETQGTSLALFYRCFAFILLSYAIGFPLIDWLQYFEEVGEAAIPKVSDIVLPESHRHLLPDWTTLCTLVGKGLKIAFFLVVHLMKLHSLSLVWGVTTEAMEYEDVAASRQAQQEAENSERKPLNRSRRRTRLQRLSLIGFGGTLGGIAGSVLASSMARLLKLSGLLILAAILLEVSAQLSIELGRVMQKHWMEQQLFQSNNTSSKDLGSLDTSIKRSASLGSMKRVASGNSLNKVRSTSDLSANGSSHSNGASMDRNGGQASQHTNDETPVNDDSFLQRLLRGITTILRSRLLMAIFTYNALYASTNVLLSFERAALVKNQRQNSSTEADMAFLANINMASSIAIFGLQASGIGAYVAQTFGSRGTLSLMPLIRLLGVLALAWWHLESSGQPPNLIVFLIVDECCKVLNLAVAKPVRESLWRGLSNEARYEAKPIVDTLANRWGGGSAAFLVSILTRTLDVFGVEPDPVDGSRSVFGVPPVLFLCLVIAAWWVGVSLDLGQIRKRIDLELKKRQ